MAATHPGCRLPGWEAFQKGTGDIRKELIRSLCRLDNAVDDARSGPSRRVAEQPALTAYHEWFHGTLAAVIVDLKSSVQEKTLFAPLALAIPYGLSE